MKAVVFSLGCKVNACEGQSLIAELRALGWEADDVLAPADVYVLNTCSVTAEADKKSRQAVARMRKLNPSARIYVCGCSSQNCADAFSEKAGVCFVAGTSGKSAIVSRIMRDIQCDLPPETCVGGDLPRVYEEMRLPEHTKTRSYVKIQDGCNNFCSYCIIPYLRGRSRSRSIESIVREAEQAAAVTREIVLIGINTSAYGADIGENLCSLFGSLAHVPVRKRIGSLECTVINDELLAAMAESGVCDHFHLSLQSGSESVLRRMNRKYTPAFFYDCVQKIRSVFPWAGITTDVITGFGGETEEEFLQTEAFVNKVAFSELHVFPYSEREGTRAAQLPQIPKAVRQERAARLIETGQALHRDFCARNLGRTVEVYAETQEGEFSAGYTSNYLRVYSSVPVGECKKVTLKEIYKEGVKASYEK